MTAEFLIVVGIFLYGGGALVVGYVLGYYDLLGIRNGGLSNERYDEVKTNDSE